jgi:NAD(P)-dependent dehydrogenase (short-subunit alcohol dehydrogenase family)
MVRIELTWRPGPLRCTALYVIIAAMSRVLNVAVVTGSGGTGCGRAIAARFAGAGASVVVSDINETGGHETVRQIENGGGRAAFFPADVGSESQARQLIEFAKSKFGGLSVLVNNASAPHPTADGIAGWTHALQTDLLGTMHATRWAIEAMRQTGGGSIVNISSISALWHGRKTPGGFNGYDVAKSGVIRLTTVLAKDLAKDRIRVNCLAPGWIATEGPLEYWQSLTPNERKMQGVPEKLLAPAEVAGMVVRLATDKSLTGRVIVWWSEDSPRLVEWGDRGYRHSVNLPPLLT